MKNSITAISICVVLLLHSPGLLGQTEKPVTFFRDSLQLVGMLHLPKNLERKVPAVLMLHGFTGHKAETHFIYARLARHLAKQGIAALRFDFAGSGDSQGEFANMTILTELQDAKKALDFLHRQVEIDNENIGLLGFSMGGCVAALLAGEHPNFTAMVLWAPVADPVETFTYIAEKYLPKKFSGKEVFDLHGFYVSRSFIEILPQLKPLEAVAEFSAPALVIQGSDDKSVPVSAGRNYIKILQANNPLSRLRLIENAGHIFASLELTDEVVHSTVSWFEKYLSK